MQAKTVFVIGLSFFIFILATAGLSLAENDAEYFFDAPFSPLRPPLIPPDNLEYSFQPIFRHTKTCDTSPEGTLPFGQKRLTTHWPQINGQRGPISMLLPDAGNVTLSWDMGSTITGGDQIEYEVKYKSNFTVLDNDDPESIQKGTLMGAAGQHPLVLATEEKDLGTYYVRIGAQDHQGQDVALRSQPVIVHVNPPFTVTEVVPTMLPIGAWFVNPNTKTRLKIDGHGWSKSEVKISSTFDGTAHLDWETKLTDCAMVQLHLVEEGPGGKLIHTEKQIGSDVHYGCSTEDGVVSCTEREGSFDITSVVANLAWGKKYGIWIHPLNSAGNKIDLPSNRIYLSVHYRSPFIETAMIRGQYIGTGTPKGQPFLSKIEWSKVTPHYGCIPNDHGQIHFIFSEPMDTQSVESNLTVIPPWPDVEILWHENDTRLGYGNMSNLWFDTTYSFTLEMGAKTKTGKSILETPVQWRIQTLPYAETCPEITCMGVSPPEVLVPPYSSGIAKDVCFTFQTTNAEILSTQNFYLNGYWQANNYPKLPGGSFLWLATAKASAATFEQWGQNPYWEINIANALGWATGRLYYKIEEMTRVNADLGIQSVSWKNDECAIHVVNHGPAGIPRIYLPYLSVDTRFIATTHGVVDSKVHLGQGSPQDGDFAPNTERIVIAKTDDLPGGVVKKHHWAGITYALINLHLNTKLVEDTNSTNNFFKQDTSF